jgi:dienelactone hydrolase
MTDLMPKVPGFEAQTLSFDGISRGVYRAGSGPAVIVMSEIPGITPAVAGFAQC